LQTVATLIISSSCCKIDRNFRAYQRTAFAGFHAGASYGQSFSSDGKSKRHRGYVFRGPSSSGEANRRNGEHLRGIGHTEEDVTGCPFCADIIAKVFLRW
jgi:hypothetical protein